MIISDVALAGMSGIQILALLRERGDLTCFVLLAWPEEDVVPVVEARPAAAFLYEKPVDVQDIRDALFSMAGGSFQQEACALKARMDALAQANRFRALAAPRLNGQAFDSELAGLG